VKENQRGPEFRYRDLEHDLQHNPDIADLRDRYPVPAAAPDLFAENVPVDVPSDAAVPVSPLDPQRLMSVAPYGDQPPSMPWD